jgi:hypothetical protein
LRVSEKSLRGALYGGAIEKRLFGFRLIIYSSIGLP